MMSFIFISRKRLRMFVGKTLFFYIISVLLVRMYLHWKNDTYVPLFLLCSYICITENMLWLFVLECKLDVTLKIFAKHMYLNWKNDTDVPLFLLFSYIFFYYWKYAMAFCTWCKFKNICETNICKNKNFLSFCLRQ